MRGSEEEVCVVMPVYKNQLDAFEVISLTQCHRVLGKYKKFLVCPHNINLQHYLSISGDLEVIHFDSRYFKNLITYSELMLSHSFDQCFRQYKHILIYHLDAFTLLYFAMN